MATLWLARAGPAQAAEVSVLPFAWVPSLSGQLEFGTQKVPLHVSPTQLAQGARAGAMLYGERTAGKTLIFGQVLAAKFRDNRFSPLFDLRVGAELVSMEAGIGRPIEWHQVTVTPFVAGRYNHLGGSMAGGPAPIKASRDWEEFLLGGSAKYQIAERLDIQARYSVATLFRGRDHNWDLIAASSYKLAPHVAIVGGYRWSRQHVDPSNGHAFGFHLTARGPLIGLWIK